MPAAFQPLREAEIGLASVSHMSAMFNTRLAWSDDQTADKGFDMPRYHFNVHDDLKGTSPDWAGIELADLEAARCEAVQFAGESIAESALHHRHGGDWHLEVTDGTGCPLFVVKFQISPTLADVMA